jgi:hypothetical protein
VQPIVPEREVETSEFRMLYQLLNRVLTSPVTPLVLLAVTVPFKFLEKTYDLISNKLSGGCSGDIAVAKKFL